MSWCKLLQMSHADANNFDLAFIAFKQSVLTEQNHYTKNNDSWVSICAPDVLILIVRPIYNQIEARLCCPSAPVKQQVWLQAVLLKSLGSFELGRLFRSSRWLLRLRHGGEVHRVQSPSDERLWKSVMDWKSSDVDLKYFTIWCFLKSPICSN